MDVDAAFGRMYQAFFSGDGANPPVGELDRAIRNMELIDGIVRDCGTVL